MLGHVHSSFMQYPKFLVKYYKKNARTQAWDLSSYKPACLSRRVRSSEGLVAPSPSVLYDSINKSNEHVALELR